MSSSIDSSASGKAGRGLTGLGGAAAGELRDRHCLQVRGPVLQPAGRRQRAHQLLFGEPAKIPGRLLGEGGENRAGAQHVGCLILPIRRAESVPAEAVRAGDGGQQRRVHIGGVAEADGDGGALDLPLLGNPVRHPVRGLVVVGGLCVRLPVHDRSSFRVITACDLPMRTV